MIGRKLPLRLLGIGLLAATLGGCPWGGDDDGDGVRPVVVRGCTDIAALNFDRDATTDNGSCTFDAAKVYSLEAFDQGVNPKQRQVTVLFQVTDAKDKGVVGLGNNDFRIAENKRLVGVESRPDFEARRIPFSIRTVLLLDLSSSVERQVPQIKQSAIALINSQLPNQEFAIYRFDSQASLVRNFTSDRAALINAINSLPESGLLNSTNIYGSIRTAAATWEDKLSVDTIANGSIVLFTDGFHNANSLTVGDALQALRNKDGSQKKLFVAALNSPDLSRAPLQQLTSGHPERFVEAADVSGLANAFRAIQSEIENLSNSLYLLTYQSPITDPAAQDQKLEIAIYGNSNRGNDGKISTTFSSRGFGQ